MGDVVSEADPHPYAWEATLWSGRTVRKSETLIDVGVLGEAIASVTLLPLAEGWPAVELKLRPGEAASVFRTRERDLNGPKAGVTRTLAVGLCATRGGVRLNVIWLRRGMAPVQAPTYEALMALEGAV